MDDNQQDILALLDRHCALSTGVVASTSTLQSEGSDVNDEWYSFEEDDEWTGIPDIDNEGGQPPTLIYRDSLATASDVVAPTGKDSFMSSKVRARTAGASTIDKGKKRARNEDNEDAEEEQHLRTLDASLQTLLTASTSVSSLLPTLNNLPSFRHSTRREQIQSNNIDKRAPRVMRERIYSARLERAKVQAREQREAGIIGTKNGKYALNKKSRRLQTGEEDKRRKTAQGMNGVVGKMKGGTLKISKRDIATTARGDDVVAGKRSGGSSGSGRNSGRGRGKRS